MANTVRLSGLFQKTAGYKDATGQPAQAYDYTPATVSERGEAMLRFSIAATRGTGEDLKISYLRCVAYGAIAEALAEQAGNQVDVNGHITINKVKKGDAPAVYYTNIIVDGVNGTEVA